MPKIDALLIKAIEAGASDVHVPANSPPIFRRFGQLKKMPIPPLAPKVTLALLHELLTPQQKTDFEANWELDFPYELPGRARFRCNALVQRHGVDLCFRIIRPNIPSFEELGLPTPHANLAVGSGTQAYQIGAIVTGTLLGSAALTTYAGLRWHRHPARTVLLLSCVLMAATGTGFASFTRFWPLLAVVVWVLTFFRDPVRVTPLRDGLVIAPADGYVCSVGRFAPPP